MITRTVDRCNELIETENKLSSELKQLRDETAAVKGRLETAKSSSADCADTISLYETFKQQNENHIDTISSYYTAQWESFESRCFEWSAHELVVYFQKIGASVFVESNAADEQSSVNILSS